MLTETRMFYKYKIENAFLAKKKVDTFCHLLLGKMFANVCVCVF